MNGRQGIGYSVENLLSILEHLLFGDGDLLPTILIGCGTRTKHSRNTYFMDRNKPSPASRCTSGFERGFFL